MEAMARPIVVAFEKGNFAFMAACKRDLSVTTNIKKAFVQLIQLDLDRYNKIIVHHEMRKFSRTD